MRTWSYFFAFFLFVMPLGAEIRSCHEIEDLLAEVDETTLVLCDIDNTLIEMAQTLGSDQWFNQQLQNLLKAGRSLDQALDELLPVWWRIVKVSEVVPVEPCTVGVFEEVQKRALAVVGLTSRGRELVECTQRQLSSVGMDFMRNTIHSGFGRVIRYSSNDYEAGVIYCEGANKGVVAKEFLDRYCSGLEIRKVVVLDDTFRHLERIEQHLANLPYDYVGLRYGAADEKVQSFNPGVANVQLKAFEFIMPDTMAQALLEGRYEEAFQDFVQLVRDDDPLELEVLP